MPSAPAPYPVTVPKKKRGTTAHDTVSIVSSLAGRAAAFSKKTSDAEVECGAVTRLPTVANTPTAGSTVFYVSSAEQRRWRMAFVGYACLYVIALIVALNVGDIGYSVAYADVAGGGRVVLSPFWVTPLVTGALSTLGAALVCPLRQYAMMQSTVDVVRDGERVIGLPMLAIALLSHADDDITGFPYVRTSEVICVAALSMHIALTSFVSDTMNRVNEETDTWIIPSRTSRAMPLVSNALSILALGYTFLVTPSTYIVGVARILFVLFMCLQVSTSIVTIACSRPSDYVSLNTYFYGFTVLARTTCAVSLAIDSAAVRDTSPTTFLYNDTLATT